MNKKIISGICAAVMMLGTVALADGGLTSACAKNASDIAEVKDLALVVKANSEKYGTRLYNIDQSISNLQSQVADNFNYIIEFNARCNELEQSKDHIFYAFNDRITKLEKYCSDNAGGYIDADITNLYNQLLYLQDRVYQLEKDGCPSTIHTVNEAYDLAENANKAVSDLTDYTESFHADYNSNMDMIYARCDELQAQNASLQAELSNAYSQIANLQAQIDALSAYVYG